ncbi:MAG: MoaD/ThiS family protein [Firmicutes bacterium]|nr:MoaD/ThiS family protein [Bacillota bacterium]
MDTRAKPGEPILVTVRGRPGIKEKSEAQQVRLPGGATVADLLARLALTSRPEELVILCNGVRAEAGRKLAAGDTLWVFYAMSGG